MASKLGCRALVPLYCVLRPSCSSSSTRRSFSRAYNSYSKDRKKCPQSRSWETTLCLAGCLSLPWTARDSSLRGFYGIVLGQSHTGPARLESTQASQSVALPTEPQCLSLKPTLDCAWNWFGLNLAFRSPRGLLLRGVLKSSGCIWQILFFLQIIEKQAGHSRSRVFREVETLYQCQGNKWVEYSVGLLAASLGGFLAMEKEVISYHLLTPGLSLLPPQLHITPSIYQYLKKERRKQQQQRSCLLF